MSFRVRLFRVFSIFAHGAMRLGQGILETFLSGDEKAHRAVKAIELNKTIKGERDAVLGRASCLPQDSHLGSRESRLYVDEDSIFL